MAQRRHSDANVVPPGPKHDTRTLKRTATTTFINKNSRLFSETVDAKVLASISDVEIKRQQVIHEIYLTEKQYVNDIKLTIRCFLNPIRHNELLTKPQLASVFGNIEALVPINDGILASLNKRRNTFGPVLEKIGDIFLHSVNLFKIYAVYCSTNRFSTKRLKKYRQENAKLDEFLQSLNSKKVLRGLHLQDFLILPLQRICKYPLLFKSLLEETPENHPDRKDLEEVQKIFSQIVAQINERTRQVENVEQLTELQAKYSFLELGLDLVSRERELVQEDIVTVWKNKKEVDDIAIVLLFNDQMVVLHPKHHQGEYELVLHVPLPLASVSRSSESLDMIQLVHGKKEYSFRFKHERFAELWMNNFQKLTQILLAGITETKRKLRDPGSYGRNTSKSLSKRIYESISRRPTVIHTSSDAVTDRGAPVDIEKGVSEPCVNLRGGKPRRKTPSAKDIFDYSAIEQPQEVMSILQVGVNERISHVKKLLENQSPEEGVHSLLRLLEEEYRASAQLRLLSRNNTGSRAGAIKKGDSLDSKLSPVHLDSTQEDTGVINISYQGKPKARFSAECPETAHSPKPPPRSRARGSTEPPLPTPKDLRKSDPENTANNEEQTKVEEPKEEKNAIENLLSTPQVLSAPTFGDTNDVGSVVRLAQQFESTRQNDSILRRNFSPNRRQSYRTNSGRRLEMKHEVTGWERVAQLEEHIELLLEDRSKLVTAITTATDLLHKGETNLAKDVLSSVPLCAPNIVQQRAKKIENETLRNSLSLSSNTPN